MTRKEVSEKEKEERGTSDTLGTLGEISYNCSQIYY